MSVILDFEYSSRGRDIDIVEPVLSYLELTANVKVVRCWIFKNPALDILKIKPDAVIVANGIGSREHFNIVKFASLLGVKTITLTSEGDFVESKVQAFFWGWNTDRKLYEDLNLQWSKRNIDLINRNIPFNCIENTKIVLSGATGFDKYKLLQFMTKTFFLEKYKLNFQKVIGIAGWGFDHFFGEYYDNNKAVYEGDYSNTDIEIFRKSLFELIKGYKNIIENYPDILFILKLHPLQLDMNYCEFKGLESLSNVIILKTEENIYDIINVCDLWIAFESTTCLEAWLLEKHTLLYNPLGSNFKRSIISKGSVVVEKSTDLLSYIDEFYSNGSIKSFCELEEVRQVIIRDVIGFSDGENHIRAANEIVELLENNKKKSKKINAFIFRMLVDAIRRYVRDILVYNSFFWQLPFLGTRIMRFRDYWLPMYNQTEREKHKSIYKSALQCIIKKNV